jgi:hypothetical protein
MSGFWRSLPEVADQFDRFLGQTWGSSCGNPHNRGVGIDGVGYYGTITHPGVVTDLQPLQHDGIGSDHRSAPYRHRSGDAGLRVQSREVSNLTVVPDRGILVDLNMSAHPDVGAQPTAGSHDDTL